MSEKKNGAQIVWESLLEEGVDVVFGLPGGGVTKKLGLFGKLDFRL